MKNTNISVLATAKQVHKISTTLRIKKELLSKAGISSLEADTIIKKSNSLSADMSKKDFWNFRSAVETLVYKQIGQN